MIIPSRRRFFLLGAAALAAPAIAKASNLMPISVLRPPKLWGDGIHDDTEALQWLIDDQARKTGDVYLRSGNYLISKELVFESLGRASVENCMFFAKTPMKTMLHFNKIDVVRVHQVIFDCNQGSHIRITDPEWQPSVSPEYIDGLLAADHSRGEVFRFKL